MYFLFRSVHKLDCLAADCKLFVRRNNSDLHLAVGCGEDEVLAALLVLLLVKLDPEVSEILKDFPADDACVLADAAGESDGVNAVHGCRVGTDVLRDPV